MSDRPWKDFDDKVDDALRKFSESQAKKGTHRAAKFSVIASLLSIMLSIATAAYTIWISHTQELYRLSSELKDMTVELAKAEEVHSYGGNTNILAKQAAITADRLGEASSPEYSVIANALFDTDGGQSVGCQLNNAKGEPFRNTTVAAAKGLRLVGPQLGLDRQLCCGSVQVSDLARRCSSVPFDFRED